MKTCDYDSKKMAAFYDFDKTYGAAYYDIAESQYGVKDGIIKDPSRYYFFHEILLGLLRRQIDAGSVLLDIGCGAGILAEVAHDRVRKYAGVDISQERIRQAEERIKFNNCSFEVQDAQHLTFRDSSFDIAAAIEVIEHIPDTDLFLKGINRILAKDGILIISTPTNLFFRNKLEDLYKDQHIYEFNIPALKSILTRNGFSIKSVMGIGFKSPRIVIPVCLGSDIIKYFYKKIKNVKLNAGYGHPISVEFNVVSNRVLNRMYFTRRWKSLAAALMKIFGFFGSHFPFLSSNMVIICQK